MSEGNKRKPYGWQMCEEGLLELWPQLYHPRLQVEGDVAGVTMRGVRLHAPVNLTVFFLWHGFIKFMYINKILYELEKGNIWFLYNMCYNVNNFVSQPMGLDFTSGSGFCQWVWIVPVGLDCQWVWIWKPHGPDSLLYHVIYTQQWHNGQYHVRGREPALYQRTILQCSIKGKGMWTPNTSTFNWNYIWC